MSCGSLSGRYIIPRDGNSFLLGSGKRFCSGFAGFAGSEVGIGALGSSNLSGVMPSASNNFLPGFDKGFLVVIDFVGSGVGVGV